MNDLHRVIRGRITFILLLIAILIALKLAVPFYLRLACPFDYKDEVLYYSRIYGVDPLLVVSIIRVESGFNPDACSSKGACGLMQVMPDTAKWVIDQIEFEQEFNEEMLFDPVFNIQIGAWYLAYLERNFEGNRMLVLAAYNGGKGRVQRWLDQGLWDGSVTNIESIPFPETKNYIQRVERTYLRYRWFYYNHIS